MVGIAVGPREGDVDGSCVGRIVGTSVGACVVVTVVLVDCVVVVVLHPAHVDAHPIRTTIFPQSVAKSPQSNTSTSPSQRGGGDVEMVVDDVTVDVVIVDVVEVVLLERYSSTISSSTGTNDPHDPHMFGQPICTARSAQLKPGQKGRSVTSGGHGAGGGSTASTPPAASSTTHTAVGWQPISAALDRTKLSTRQNNGLSSILRSKR